MAKSHLMMRYHAPLESFDRHLKWVIQICRKAAITEVIFMVDPEEYFHGFPTLKRVRQWVEVFSGARPRLADQGIIMSLNPWVTLGHGGRPYRSKGLSTMVGDDGTTVGDTACPADPAWQKYLAKTYALFAQASPKILWLEDDLRLHNHGNVQFGCFARPMLEEFGRRTGRVWRRGDLVKDIVRGRGPARAQWIKFTGDLWVENVRRIRQAVHRVNPEVRLAQMTSSMAAHSAEGRNWSDYLGALGGRHRPITRPHFGPYREATGFEFVVGLTAFRHALAFAGRKTRCCPEMENWPFSYFSKSRRQSQLMLELTQFFGCRDVTLDYFSMAGNDPSHEPWVVRQIRDARPRMDALAALGLDQRQERGVHLWTHEAAALVQHTQGRPPAMNSLRPGFDGWAKILTRLGVASTFETPGSITAVCGDTIRCASPEEIRRILSGGVLLDGRAALALQEMGFAHLLGVSVGETFSPDERRPVSLEKITDHRFALKGSTAMGVAMMGADWREGMFYCVELCGASRVSSLVDAQDQMSLPGLTLFENELGGRVAIWPYDFDSGLPDSVRFYNHVRKYQVQSALCWLNRGQKVTQCPDQTLVALERSACQGRELMTVVNLSGDPISSFNLNLEDAPRGLALLDDKGRWKKQPCYPRAKAAFRVLLPRPLEPFEAAFLRWPSSS